MEGRIKSAVFQFQPFSVKQKKVLTWWLPSSPVHKYDGIVADGAIRSGKTVSMSLSFVMWAMESFSNQNFAMCGKTIGSFRRNVLTCLKLMLISRGYGISDHRADNFIEIRRKGRVNYFYLFGGKDERSQDLIQGITLAGVFFDEVALMPESFVNQATGRCSVSGSKFWFNCNPDNPAHWFYINWIQKIFSGGNGQKRLLHLHFMMDDNLSLSEEVKKRYYSTYTGVFFDRYIKGLWVPAEGLVYPMFDMIKHTYSDELNKNGTWYISVDYGTLNPCSMGLWCVSGGIAYRTAEYYHNGRNERRLLTDEEYCDAMETLAGKHSIEKVIIDPSAASFKEAIRRRGKFRAQDARNEVIDGIRITAALLNGGRLKFAQNCKDTIKEFGAYCWDMESPEDKVIKENDHAMDDIRYFCNTILCRELRWADWR